MLDIKFIRENPDLIKEAARKKGIELDISKVIKSDELRREALKKVDDLRAEMNKAAEMIAGIENEDEKRTEIEKVKDLKERIAENEENLKKIDEEFNGLMLEVPNVPDPSVPEGKSDAENKEIKKWGKPTLFDFEPKDHFTIMKNLDLVDTERGAKVSGMRGYFLKNEALMLSFALWKFSLDHLISKGFTLIGAPAIVRGKNLVGTGHFPQNKEDVYSLGDDQYLAGTSEISLMGLHSGEILNENELPKKYVAFSPCYRREAGSYGKDTKGLYRLHEFYKTEQMMLIKNNHTESVKWHEELTKNSEEIMQMLNMPYRVVTNCTGDIGRAHVKTYDIESWIPSEKKYRETHSSSYYHDFQSRRLKIRYRDLSGNVHFVHSLNSTVTATPRLLIALIENNQTEEGNVNIPEVLQTFVGKNIIKRV